MIKQEFLSKNCGQCCLATILNISLEDAINLIGHNKGTKSKELIKYFKCSKNKRGFPKNYSLCICREKGMKGGNWHWVLYKDGKIYCPGLGFYIDKDLYHLKISSYFEIL